MEKDKLSILERFRVRLTLLMASEITKREVSMPKADMEPAGKAEGTVSGWGVELGARMSMVIDMFDTKSMAANVGRVSREQMMRQVKGLNRPFFDTVARICWDRGVSLDWLWTGVGPMLQSERMMQARAAAGELAPMDEALLGNLVAGVERFLVHEDLIVEADAKSRLFVVLYRMVSRIRRELESQGITPPDEFRLPRHPIDVTKYPDVVDVIRLVG